MDPRRNAVTAVEFQVSAASVDQLRTSLALVAREVGIDIAVSPGGLARLAKKLVVMDVDSTLIQQEVIELLGRRAGKEAEIKEITDRAMRGELDFEASLRAVGLQLDHGQPGRLAAAAVNVEITEFELGHGGYLKG
mgnify:CR=1 FL=1